MLKSISHLNNKTYVGFTTNYKKRLLKHNSGKGAKSTKGYQWVLIYKKLFLSKQKDKWISYVGYTNNIRNRILLHNSSKGAKFTKGKKWKLIYFKKYQSKMDAMKNEYKLKKDYKLRKKIKLDFLNNE